MTNKILQKRQDEKELFNWEYVKCDDCSRENHECEICGKAIDFAHILQRDTLVEIKTCLLCASYVTGITNLRKIEKESKFFTPEEEKERLEKERLAIIKRQDKQRRAEELERQKKRDKAKLLKLQRQEKKKQRWILKLKEEKEIFLTQELKANENGNYTVSYGAKVATIFPDKKNGGYGWVTTYKTKSHGEKTSWHFNLPDLTSCMKEIWNKSFGFYVK